MRMNLSFWNPVKARSVSLGTSGMGRMGMDESRFARKSRPARANRTDGGDLRIRPTIAPAENGEVDEIKSAVLAKLTLELGKDASVATDRDWFVAAALTIRDRVVHRWLAVDRASHASRQRLRRLSLLNVHVNVCQSCTPTCKSCMVTVTADPRSSSALPIS